MGVGTHGVGYLQSTDLPSNLFTIRPDDSELTQITDYAPGAERASQPTWTPDGRIVVHRPWGGSTQA